MIDRDAQRTVGVGLRLHFGFPPLQLSAFGRRNCGALGITDADQQSVRPERKRDAFEVVVVGGFEGGEEIVGDRLVAGVGVEAANGIRLPGAEAHLGAARAIGVGVIAFGRVDTWRVKERLLEGVDAEVAEKFWGENREGGANVAQTRAHARAGERLGGGVAIVLVGGDLERCENDGVTFHGLNRRSRDRLG
ncbi:unannotated protein [freshwater metagenome]|uniref:Unannotated protein n=1 Tax=freshwater metagenome TaxID=449393 RepID=A0A6J6C3R3_9ZZZZ